MLSLTHYNRFLYIYIFFTHCNISDICMAKTIYSIAFRLNTRNEETNFFNTPLPLKRDGVLILMYVIKVLV